VWIASAIVDGAAVPLTDWLSRATIRHGRGAIYDDPTASVCTMTLLDPPRQFVHDLGVGATLAVDWTTRNYGEDPAAGAVNPRFRGRITDLSLNDPELTLIATGPLANLKRDSVSTAGWTVLPWSQAVVRLLDACGVTHSVVAPAGWDPDVHPPPEAEVAVNGYLKELADAVGAAVFDEPDGRVAVQAIGSRGSTGAAITLNPAEVPYSPTWTQDETIQNRVTVIYGPNRESSKTSSDPASVARYGPHRHEISTTLVNEADAERRALERLVRSAWPRWAIQPVRTLVPSPAPYRVGRRVTVSTLPTTAPYEYWAPVIEGWADLIDGPDWVMEFYLSDPLASGFTARWVDADDDVTWASMGDAMQWQDVNSREDIGG